jgi:GNAT superfamily N-acetyltransferase
VAESAARGERLLLVAGDGHGEICGTVQVLLQLPENQPHRGDLAKMLVHRRARGRGVGAALLTAAEEHAQAAGRTLLVLDTVTHGDAERLYVRSGWQRCGEIPQYALWPAGGFTPTTVYFKFLAGASAAAAPAARG